MTKLVIAPTKQKYEKSCWAACIGMVLKLDTGSIFDDDLIARNAGIAEANEYQDVAEVMKTLNIFDATDDEDVRPSFKEIKEEIDKGRPIVQCLNSKEIKPFESSSGGHYVLIIGYENDDTIIMIDPSDASEIKVKYVEKVVTINGASMYYAQPYYTKKA